mmetsp:Transcript_41208/g.65349  ORF Transcript_41208/g.65349 Transcript_41208/m.65349 type:complete len:373 (-) Transcript_41208:8-1126(-)
MRWSLFLAICAQSVFADCDGECDASLLMQQKKDVTGRLDKPKAKVEAADCNHLIEAMGRGINIGNTYDMHQDDQNPKTVKERVEWIKSQGFSHVRLPVTWGDSFDPTSQLTKDVTEVADYALDLGLCVIINTHHEEWLKEHYDGSKYFNDKFWSLWHNIALHFQSRDRHLVFEILNEPEKAFGSWPGSGNWPQPFDQWRQQLTRQINAVGYDAVRKVSPDRMVFVSPNAMASIGTVKAIYPTKWNLPGGGNDECVGVTVHTYDPWNFAGDTGKNSFYGTVEKMKLGLYDTWKDLRAWQFNSGIKLYIGEFGIGRRDCCKAERNTDLVREYYKFAMNHFRANGWSAAAWDDPGWFAIYHQEGNGIHSYLVSHY